jgi:cold shock CspA family protein
MKGKIKKYLSYRGYGFIEVEEIEKDVFFHSSNFQSTEIPTQDQEVEFRIIDTPKGQEAVDVKVIPPGAEQVSEEPAETEQVSEEPAETEQVSEEPVETEQMPETGTDLGELNGVGPKYRELLTAAGINSVKSITEYAPEALLANLLAVNEAQGITKRPPTLPLVKEWIQAATDLS